MDVLSQGRFRVLNEPRGFIRIIQWFLAIIAFATCCSYTGAFKFTYSCLKAGDDEDNRVSVTQRVEISYPFDLAKSNKDFHIVDTTDCQTNHTVTPPGDVSPSASWFVFVGVLCFLYTMMALAYYIFIEPTMRVDDEIPALNNVDMVITGVTVFLWLTAASSLAWAKGQLDKITSVENFIKESDLRDFCTSDEIKCISTAPGFVKLNASIAFGFLNCVVWIGSFWFIWKEASFFKRAQPSSGTNPGA